MAIALDGAFPDSSVGRFTGRQRLVRSRRPEPQADTPAALPVTYRGADPVAGNPALAGVSAAPAAAADGLSWPATPDFDARVIKQTFSRVMADEQNAMEYFYGLLFAQSPEVRSLFPLAMTDLRYRVFAALVRLIWSTDNRQAYTTQLAQLGRDHRRFGVREKHHKAFFAALLATVEQFSGQDWTEQARSAWQAALDLASAVISATAKDDARSQPAWWVGEVVRHERRSASLAVLTIRPDQPLRYRPGQYLGVQVPRWPRVWRNFSIANAPRGSNLIDLHVRAICGGMVSNALLHASVGDTLLLGPARGDMTLPPDCDRELICVAGGTGLAPLKALIEGVASGGEQRPRTITLFLGARREQDLYDMTDLRVLQSGYPSLAIIPVISQQPGYRGITGLLHEIVIKHARLSDSEVFVSGPDAMVRQTDLALAGLVACERVHFDPFAKPRLS
ncbi:MAG TPA: globin domain-containing protein [Streptosporangiaceae bacterium]